MTPRHSIERLADDAPVAHHAYWESPARAAASDALQAQATRTARREIEASAKMYASNPRYLDTVAQGLSNLSPEDLVSALNQIDAIALMRGRRWAGCGGEIPSFNLEGAKLYAARRLEKAMSA